MHISENDRDTYVLSTGKKIYACFQTLGIGEELEVSYGSDGSISYDVDGNELTKGEWVEIADYAIGLWEQFKRSVNNNETH